MRPLLIALLALLVAPALAGAQATGPTGPSNPLPPAATTASSSDATLTAATVRGQVTANGGETRVEFQYGTTTGYGLTTATQTLPAGTTATDVQARLERLTAATTYHYRVVATSDAGVARGADRTLRTASPPSRPGVASEPATAVTLDAATLQARIDPNRQATTYEFQYGTSTRYGATTPVASAGGGDAGVRVAARIGGLRANTLYHFRVRATNATGTTTGADRSFRAAKVPLGLRASVSAQVVRYTRFLGVTGVATGTDNRNLTVALERRNFPFDAAFRPFGAPLRTDASGGVRFLVPPFTLPSQFRLVAPGRADVVSNVATVRVGAYVRLRAQRLRGDRVRLTGSVAPQDAAGTVSIQRRGADGRSVFVRRLALRRGPGLARFSTIIRRRSTASSYRAATRLTGATLVDGRSQTIRLAGRSR